MLPDDLAVTPIPAHVREEGLGLGGEFGVPAASEGVACLLERVLTPRLVVAWWSARACRNNSSGRSASSSGQRASASSYSDAAAA